MKLCAVKFLFVISAVVLASLALSEQLLAAQELLSEVNWFITSVVILGLSIYQVINAGVWSDVIRSCGGKVTRGKATKVWLQSESMKWLPGAVWGYGSRVLSAKSLGLGKQLVTFTMVWEILLTNIAWLFVALTALFSFQLSQTFGYWVDTMASKVNSVVVIGGSVIVLAMIFIILRSEKLKKTLQIVGLCSSIRLGKSLSTLFEYIGLCILNASLFYLCSCAIPGVELDWLSALGVASLAWLVGFWAIGVPGGIGVREAFIVLMLQGSTGVEIAILVALLWRLSQVAAEIIAVSLVSVVGWRKNNVVGVQNYENI